MLAGPGAISTTMVLMGQTKLWWQAVVGAMWKPAPQSGSPMTYVVDGKQYIVVALSGGALLGRVPSV